MVKVSHADMTTRKTLALTIWTLPYWLSAKEFAYNARDMGSIPGSGRSLGEGNGNPLQYSCLENPMERGVWQDTVHGVTRVGHNLATKLPSPPLTAKCCLCFLTRCLGLSQLFF